MIASPPSSTAPEPSRRAERDASSAIRAAYYSPARGLASRVIVGLATVVAAILVRIPLEPVLVGHNTFILIEPAIAIAAWYGGRVSGTVATLTGVVLSIVLYLGPPGQIGLPPQNDSLALALFAINGFILTFLSAGLKNAYQHATAARMRAEESAARSHRLVLISLALNRPMSRPQLAQTAIEQSVELLGASGGVMAVGRLGDPQLRVISTYGYVGDVVPATQTPNSPESPLGEVIRTGEPLFLRGRGERVRRYPASASRFKSEGDSIVIPLLYQSIATGSIYLNFSGRALYGAEDRDFLRSIGAQCGSAWERSILIERTNQMADEEKSRAAELSTVLEAIGDGVLVGDSSGRVILANTAAKRLLGRVPANLDDLPERVEDGEGPTNRLHRHLIRSPILSRNWLEVTKFPVAADVASSEVVLIRDITRLVEADLQRDAFLGVLSHELRTPVTSILVAVDLLRRGVGPGVTRRSELLNDIDAESARLRNIVEDLLVLTRSERGALDIATEPVLVHRVVNEVVERARQDTPAADIQVRIPERMPPADAEPTYVEQIVRNLLSNALKYGMSRGHPIEVAIDLRGDEIETRVMDRGVGFGPGEAERLFTLFYRNPRAIRSAPGAGIGLYVCRLLAEAMGGRAWAASRPGGGAEFGFSLPVLEDAERLDRRITLHSSGGW